MGCYNGTCGVSQLPITYGDKVKAYVIIQADKNYKNKLDNPIPCTSLCYSDELYAPMFFPVTGLYNDYGSLKKIKKDWNYKNLLLAINELLENKQIDRLKEHAEINDPHIEKIRSCEDIFTCLERGDLIYNNPYTKKSYKMGLFMILDNIYNNLLVYVKNNNLYSHDLKYFSEGIENIKETLADEEILSNKNMRRRLIKLFIRLSEKSEFSSNYYSDILNNFDYKKSKKNIDHILSKIYDEQVFSFIMSSLRKTWFPQCGGGSQSCDLDMYQILINSMSTHITDSLKKYI